MSFWIFIAVIAACCAFVGWACVHINNVPSPKVKSEDETAEELRRERIELHNASLDYAELQGAKDRHTVTMLAAAFRMGAQWQRRQ